MAGCCGGPPRSISPPPGPYAQGHVHNAFIAQPRLHVRAPASYEFYTYSQLEAATNGFSQSMVLGEGGFGQVYRGRLPGGLHVAVKRLDRRGQQSDAEFNVEVDMLSRHHHPNLVQLLGVCIEGAHRAAVFHLMLGGSLRAALDAGASPQLTSTPARPLPRHPLTWHARLHAAQGAAAGLAFLHEEARPCIIHRDVKSTNILLDETDCAYIGDLGLARSSEHAQDANAAMAGALKGTFGYVSPEYLLNGKHSQKCDVYAFGVVLLELLTGQEPVEPARTHAPSLVQYMRPRLDTIDCTQGDLDPVLQQEAVSATQLAMFTEVAAACLQEQPKNRPCMTRVKVELQQVMHCQDTVPISPSCPVSADTAGTFSDNPFLANQEDLSGTDNHMWQAMSSTSSVAPATHMIKPAPYQESFMSSDILSMAGSRAGTSHGHMPDLQNVVQSIDIEWPPCNQASLTSAGSQMGQSANGRQEMTQEPWQWRSMPQPCTAGWHAPVQSLAASVSSDAWAPDRLPLTSTSSYRTA